MSAENDELAERMRREQLEILARGAADDRASGAGRKRIDDLLEESRRMDAAAPRGWVQHLRTDKRGPIDDEENVRLALVHDPALSGIVAFNEFAERLVLMRRIPLDAHAETGRLPRPWRDEDTGALQGYFQRTVFPRIGRERIDGAVRMHARYTAAFHPVRDYLDSLRHDGTERVVTWLHEYLGAGDPQPYPFVCEVARAFLVAAVARIYRPGCQADSALVLEGPQGEGKTTALRILAGTEYFTDSLPHDVSSKDARDHLRGAWIVELPELAQFRRSEIETVKAFISRREERFRPAYGRHEVTFPRQCVFVGTTNESEYLVDTTGNRRFWCVRCGAIDLEGLARDRDQLWAEAVALYQGGALWHLTGQTAQAAAAEARQRLASDPWLPMVATAVKGARDVAPGEILQAIDVRPDQRNARAATRIAAILRDLGWRRGSRDRTRGQLYVAP